MPWISIIIWLITYLISSSQKGVSKGKAALIATGVAGAAYLAQTEGGFGDGAVVPTTTPEATSESGAASSPTTGVVSTIGPTLSSLGKSASQVLSTPGGQVALVGGTLAATGASSGIPKWVLWGGIGLGAYLILRK